MNKHTRSESYRSNSLYEINIMQFKGKVRTICLRTPNCNATANIASF